MEDSGRRRRVDVNIPRAVAYANGIGQTIERLFSKHFTNGAAAVEIFLEAYLRLFPGFVEHTGSDRISREPLCVASVISMTNSR